MNTECLVIGDLNVDLVLNDLTGFPALGKEITSDDYTMVIGGSGGIFTAVLSELGVRTSIISKIGVDFYGQFILDKLEKSNADTSRIIVSETEKTGITISLSYEKDKSQISSVNTIRNLKIDEIHLKDMKSIRHVHFSSYYMMESLKNSYIDIIRKIRSLNKEMTFSFDTNDDPRDEWGPEIYDIFKFIDILFLNKKEAIRISEQTVVEQAAKKLSEYVSTIIIKLGIEGYFARIGDKTYRGYCNNTGNINFLDGTGSGDNFDAAFIFGFLNDFNIEKNLEFANFCAEKSIEYIGGVGDAGKFRHIKDVYGIK
jgi:sugar/nucleoside kinase (ribokinase family)